MRESQRLIGLSFAIGVGLGGGAAFGQTPGTQTSNPYPGVPVGMTVAVRDVATLPTSDGAPARLNSAAVDPNGNFFVVDQRGPVYALSPAGLATPYLDVRSLNLGLLNDNGERGLSQIAFHPQFDQPGTPGYGKAYLSFSTSNTAPTPDFASPASTRTHDEVIYELTTNAPTASTFALSSARQVLRIAEPATNHNGGGMAFKPDGRRRIGRLRCALLQLRRRRRRRRSLQAGPKPRHAARLDPAHRSARHERRRRRSRHRGGQRFASDNNANTLAENYAYGFRNPQRFSWDRGGTHRMFIGDVGQGTVEEVDAGVNGGNFGWSLREGNFIYVNGNTVAYPSTRTRRPRSSRSPSTTTATAAPSAAASSIAAA